MSTLVIIIITASSLGILLILLTILVRLTPFLYYLLTFILLDSLLFETKEIRFKW